MRGRIFISYRRGDTSAEARSIYQRLERSFGSKRLFMDVDSITKGRDFGLVLTETLANCAVMLVIVGRRWLSARDDDGRRKLDDPNDFVRLEISAALKRNIPVIPVRIERARMPKADELPDDLKPFAVRQAAIMTHDNFSGDMGGIERDLHLLLDSKLTFSRINLVAISSSVLTAICLTLLWLWWPAKEDVYLPPLREPAQEAALVPESQNQSPPTSTQRSAPQNYSNAREEYEKAAALGNAEAMVQLALVYANGQGVAQDYGKAREWFEKAADKGDVTAMRSLGVLYANGEGGAQDYAKAHKWYEKAIERGETDAMVGLGALYANGQGVAQDYAKALAWFEKAADKGNAIAMRSLGVLYEKGQGVARDPAKAREWYKKAAAKGDAKAKGYLEQEH